MAERYLFILFQMVCIMNYINLLETSAKKYNSIICLGLDPVLDRIPVNESKIEKRITVFFESILNEIVRTGIYPSAAKPNYAFFAQYGFEGLQALKDVISLYRDNSIPVILDAKRGDIGTTSAAYAKEAFDFFEADSVTLAPYMGKDSVAPFAESYPDKGFYVLCRTSNKSAKEFQDLAVDGTPLYIKVAEKICEWNYSCAGIVAGATYPEELSRILDVFSEKGKSIPLLIPGVGTQGADVKTLMSVLMSKGNIDIHRINSSSGILYAHEKNTSVGFEAAAVCALKKLNEEVNSFRC